MVALNCLSHVSPHDQFTRHEIVGKGAYGQVYRAVHNATGEVVALKIIKLDTADDDITEIQREVQLLTQLRDADKHNCTLYHGCWLVNTHLWIAMDYAGGGSIRTIMKSCKTVEEKFSVLIIREVLVALSYLHKQAIIHRDIKAANVLLTNGGKILLCDFGVAAHLSSSNKRATFIGTPYWMAPEVIQDGKLYDTKADIWSLGITLYEMSMGNPPFANYEALRALQLIPRSKPATLEGTQWSPAMREFLALCLTEEPAERPTAEELTRSKWIKSASKVPTVILRDLVHRYSIWVREGGVRQSLINADSSPEDPYEQDTPESSWDFASPVPGEEQVHDNVEGLGTDLGYGSKPAQAPPRNHPLLRIFDAEDGASTSNTFAFRQPPPVAPPPVQHGLGFSVPAETIRPSVKIPSLDDDDSDDDSPPPTARSVTSPTTLRAPVRQPSIPVPPSSLPSSPQLGSSPRLGKRSPTPPSPNPAITGFVTPTDSSFPDIPPPPMLSSGSPSRPQPNSLPREGGVDKLVISPTYRSRANTLQSQGTAPLLTTVNSSPPSTKPGSARGKMTVETTLAPTGDRKTHARKVSAASNESRVPSPSPSVASPSVAWPNGPPIRPLDYMTLTSTAAVHLELERTVADLGNWLKVLDDGFAQLATA